MAIQFSKATKTHLKLRVALDGPSGSGKTYTALQVAKLLGGSTCLIDSEHESSKLYADKFEFDQGSLETHSLMAYLEAIQEAAKAGYQNLIIDSLSHAWNGKGGALEQVDRAGGSKFSNGWKTVTPLFTKMIDALLSYPGNVICTMRTKTAYEVVTENGRAVPKKVGLAPVMRDGVEYEFTLVFDLNNEGGISVAKSRCSDVSGSFGRDDIPAVVRTIKDWLGQGAPLSPREAMTEKIRFAQSPEDLIALIPTLKGMSPEDIAALKPAYSARKAELSGGIDE